MKSDRPVAGSTNMTEKKIILVTGAGSGIGRAVSQVLARAGHCVYASMRLTAEHGGLRADEARQFAARESVDLRVIEMDVLSETSCRTAVDQVLIEQGRLDVVVNNAGMLMVGVTEAFAPEQLARIFDTNAISWLRVNRAALPVMRRQGRGVLVYIGSTTARIFEPFLGPYVASKVAGEALAEVMGFEVSRFGIESVIVVPGAFTSGTEHFAHANVPASNAVVAQYGDLPRVFDTLGPRLEAIDAANGGSPDVSIVGDAVRDVLELPHGKRPARVVVDSQQKGVEELNALHHAKQLAFFRQLGIDDLMTLPDSRR
jgi:NAD(P)-dependent dehydrogenase (short-subunit alcohol dehydrogenase family)